MPEAHSEFSASNFEADSLCPGRRTMQKGLPDSGSKYADEGTAAHTVLDRAVSTSTTAVAQLGTEIMVNRKAWPVTTEMAAAVQTALDNIHEIVGDGMLLSEQRVNYASYLGVEAPRAWGTSDIIAMRGSELQVHDYKHGMGVEVDADDNPQMKLYALGALQDMRAMGEEPTMARLVIHQPRIKSAPSEWTVSIADLEAWGHGEAKRAAEEQQGAAHMRTSLAMKQAEWERVYLRPNEKSCKFCRAKATCPALRAEVAKTVFESPACEPSDFQAMKPAETPKQSDEAWLAAVNGKADMILDYLKAVAAEIERRMLAGIPVPGHKLVMGKRGDRAWTDVKAAEATLATLGDAAYAPRKVISPTQAEELAPQKPKTRGPDKGKAPPPSLISAEQWAALGALITQADGRPHVAPVSDKRPALDIKPIADEFDVVTTPATTEESYA